MKLSTLFENVQGPNRFFRVEEKMDVWQGRATTPAHGGMSFPSFHRVVARPGDEIHWLHGGVFLVKGEDVKGSIHMRNPSKESEGDHHAYRHNPTGFRARLFNEAMHAGHLTEIDKSEAKHVNYSH